MKLARKYGRLNRNGAFEVITALLEKDQSILGHIESHVQSLVFSASFENRMVLPAPA